MMRVHSASSLSPSPRRRTVVYLRRVVLTCLLLVLLGAGWFVYQTLSLVHVTLVINDNPSEIDTSARTVGQLLRQQNIFLEPVDKVDPPPNTTIQNNMTITVTKATQLVIDIDGEVQRLYTHQDNPLAILAENNIPLYTNDVLLVDHRRIDNAVLGSFHQTPRHLKIVRAKHYTVQIADELVQGYTTAYTVGDLLYELETVLYLADEISPSLDTPVFDGIQVAIKPSSPVTVEVDGSRLQTRAQGETVGEVLQMLGLPLYGLDYSIPAENEQFTASMLIEVIRVIETTEVERANLPFETITIIDHSLAPQTQSILQTGMTGIEEIRWRVRNENGAVVSRSLQGRWIIQPPIPQIVAVSGE